MRDHQSPLHLWIDALSINQSDLDEKSQQVSMIGEIFSYAVEVRAWLGVHENESQRLFEDENILGNFQQTRSAKIQVWLNRAWLTILMFLMVALPLVVFIGAARQPITDIPTYIAAATLLILVFVDCIIVLVNLLVKLLRTWRVIGLRPTAWEYADFLPQLRPLLHRPYWRRTWIPQEIALARRLTIWCGGDSIGWHQFQERLLGLNLEPSVSHTGSRPSISHELLQLMIQGVLDDFLLRPGLAHIIRLAMLRYRNLTILGLAAAMDITECDQQHDRIYALLSLEPPDAPLPRIVPNYRLDIVDLVVEVLKVRFPPECDRAVVAWQFSKIIRLSIRQRMLVLRKLGYGTFQIWRAILIYLSRPFFRSIGFRSDRFFQ